MMEVKNVIFQIVFLVLVDAVIIESNVEDTNTTTEFANDLDNVFNGVYAECFFQLSYICLQKKTLLYLNELNDLSEVSVIGDFVKFVKINVSNKGEDLHKVEVNETSNSDDLALMIDKAVDNFFNNHILKFSALGKDVSMANNVEEFVGRKKRKGGGGGGDHGGDHDFGKKKMMMMAMMCMKMKLMMMVPAMMGMMGMMSFKGMMFSMMSFMISKMMLLMKLLEKKGSGAGFGGAGGGSDGIWGASAGGGGAWMPAGGQDYGGGGYDSNAQWQSRSIFEFDEKNKAVISYSTPNMRYINVDTKNEIAAIRNHNKAEKDKIDKPKSRRKRDIIDILQNSYVYWINRIFGVTNKRINAGLPKYKTVNGVRYVFYPFRNIQKVKAVKDVTKNKIKTADEGFKPIITAEDFNKGEIYEGAMESRMHRKKFYKMKDAVNDTVEDNPWE